MRNIIVTGGTRGIGLGIVRRLAEAGYRTIAVARTQTEELAEISGEVHFRSFDLAELGEIPALVKQLRREFGPIYGLVNNAASGAPGVLATLTQRHIEGLLQLNTVSPILLTGQVVRSMMVDRGGGRIVNISSIVASTGYSGLSVYGASKAAMVGFTKSLAREVGRLGITVNAVAPGFIDTAMTEGMTREQRDQIVRRSPLHRLAEPADVANAVEFLLSDIAHNITGTVLTVDAGNTA